MVVTLHSLSLKRLRCAQESRLVNSNSKIIRYFTEHSEHIIYKRFFANCILLDVIIHDNVRRRDRRVSRSGLECKSRAEKEWRGNARAEAQPSRRTGFTSATQLINHNL